MNPVRYETRDLTIFESKPMYYVQKYNLNKFATNDPRVFSEGIVYLLKFK